MKDDTDPIWEHPNNRNGGICSFKTDIENGMKVYEDLCVRMVCRVLTERQSDISDINGISISPKNNWAIIKIWNKNRSNDLSKSLSKYIIDTYHDMSIKYKENEPEF